MISAFSTRYALVTGVFHLARLSQIKWSMEPTWSVDHVEISIIRASSGLWHGIPQTSPKWEPAHALIRMVEKFTVQMMFGRICSGHYNIGVLVQLTAEIRAAFSTHKLVGPGPTDWGQMKRVCLCSSLCYPSKIAPFPFALNSAVKWDNIYSSV